ncbi:MAG: HD domain-containing protein [Bacteriovoracaceae bacterium]
MAKVFISDFSGKQEIETVLLVKIINTMEGKDGKKYFNIILSDASGEIEARLWQYSTEVESEITRGTFAKVKGKLNFYQGKKQFIITSLSKLSQEQVNMDDFVMKAKVDPEIMFKSLLQIVDGLTDVYIKELLQNILGDAEISRRLKTWQAGKSIHHAYQSGLLEHILSCSELAVTLSRHYQVNVNYVVAGCILHDLCKIYELTDGVNVEYTEEGKLVGHLVKGLEIVDRFSYRIKNFPYQLKLHLKHILLAHHGEYAYGSPKIPQTSEAYLVHLIDLMDSKMASFDIIKKTDSNTGTWSNFIKHLDRIVYKSELPFYPEYIEEGDERPKTEPRHKSAPAPTTSLGKMLSGFKVDE